MTYERICVIVMDSAGIGALPDAAAYGDEGAHTLASVCRSLPACSLPNLEMLGLGSIASLPNVPPAKRPVGCYGKMAELSIFAIGHRRRYFVEPPSFFRSFGHTIRYFDEEGPNSLSSSQIADPLSGKARKTRFCSQIADPLSEWSGPQGKKDVAEGGGVTK